MIIKKFQGKTEEEAMVKARSELGENVVLMSAKKDVKTGGFLGLFKKKMVEIIVGKEEETESNDKAVINIKDTIASVDKLRTESEKAENAGTVKTTAQTGANSENISKKLDSIQNLLQEKLDKNEESKPAEALKKEEKKESVKSEEPKPASVANESVLTGANKEMVDLLRLLYNTMLENEVNEKYANQMIEEAGQVIDKNSNMEFILSHIYQKMILRLGKAEPIKPADNNKPKVIFFIGPTGVGKTTTLAKLASLLCLKHRKKVAMFTADTFRIAASEQLKTYANILKTPFHVIYEPKDMLSCFEQYKEYDYIMIDTAGHSHHNEEQKNKMNEFVHLLDDKAEKEVYLVLSATTKYRDLISIADTYRELTDYKLIFTKLDETSAYGNILNVRMHTGAPLSYVTSGQNVPDDIDYFNPQDIVKKLLGGND